VNTDNNIAVLGAGSWGTALALVIARNGAQVTLWGKNGDRVRQMSAVRENMDYLPGFPFPDSLLVTDDLDKVVSVHSRFLVVVPSRAFRETMQKLVHYGLRNESAIAWGTKGFDPTSTQLLSEVAAQELGEGAKLAVVSGPSFAREVAAGLPTALAIASHDQEVSEEFARLLRGECMRVYTNDDLVGVQIGGAVKNVIAVATGISDGLGFGANARAALITRGLAEINRLGLACGASPQTLMGLAGLGDLVLTCTDDQSRNRRLGLGIGQGQTPTEIVANIGQEVESLVTTRELARLAREKQVEMPITEQVYNVLYNNRSALESVEALLNRDPTRE
jgi:glycerol-3-phosphate dehydrogenase (NAD(P)+)